VRRTIPIAFRRWRRRLLDVVTWREIAAFRDDLQRESYEAILDLQEQVKGAFIARLARGRRHGPDRASIREPLATLAHDAHHAIDPAQHLVDRCRQLAAAALGYRIEGPPRFDLKPPPIEASDLVPTSPYLVFVHATSRPDKLWPESHWQKLVASLTGAGFAVLLPWGTGEERARSERLARNVPAARVPPRLALASLARILADARLVVGVDTGLVHLAAALGTPTLSLFVATDPALAGVAHMSPRGRDLGGVGRIPSADDVRNAADALLREPRSTIQ